MTDPRPTGHPRALARRAAAATAALSLAGAGLAATALPAAADVRDVAVAGNQVSWGCDARLPMNPDNWQIGYALANVNGSEARYSPADRYTFDLAGRGLSTGTYHVYLRCVYVPVWDPSAGTHTTYGSANVAYTAPAVAPSAPRDVVATPGDGTVALAWHAPHSDGGAPVSYTVTREPGGVVVPVSGTGYVADGLTNGTAYTFSVTAVNTAGTSAATSVTATPLQPVATVELDVPVHATPGAQIPVSVGVTAEGRPVTGGTVTLSVGGSDEVVDLPVVDGVATTTVTLPVRSGEVAFAASYSGSDAARASSATASLWIDAVAPVLTLDAPASVVTGSPFTVSVEATGAHGVPEGDVEVVAHREGEVPVVQRAALVDGRAQITFPTLPEGTWTVSAYYFSSPAQAPYHKGHTAPQQLVVKPVPVEVAVNLPREVRTTLGTPTVLTVDLPEGKRPKTLEVRLGDAVLVTVDVPASGPVPVVLPVLDPGTYELVVSTPATDEVLASTTTVALTVAGEPVADGDEPTADVTGSPLLGTATTLTAAGFLPGETVVFYLHPGDVLLDTAVADEDGVATLDVVLSEDLAAGDHRIRATGGASGIWGELAFTVVEDLVPSPIDTDTDPVDEPVQEPVDEPLDVTPVSAPVLASSGTPSTTSATTSTRALASTGADAAALVAVHAALVLAGLALVRMRRRLS